MAGRSLPRDPGPDEIARLRRLLAGAEPTGSAAYIAVPRPDQPYATGTTVPQIGVIATGAISSGGIVLPRVDYTQQPMKYFQAFIGLDEYLGSWLKSQINVYDNDHWIGVLLAQHPKELLVIELAFLNYSLGQANLYADLVAQYRTLLPAGLLERFDAAMGKGDVTRVFAARQPILRAIREVLLYEGPVNQTLPFPAHQTAVMLAHAFATKLGHLEDTGPEVWPSVHATVFMEIIQNYLFNQREDIFPRFDRYTRLWDDYGGSLARTKLRKLPAELLTEATGVERVDLFAVAFSLFARINTWKPGQSFLYEPYPSDAEMDRATFDKALGLVSSDESSLVAELRAAPSDWQMLPFERNPVLQLPQGVVVLDQGFLLERVTSGLYWLVLEHELHIGKAEADLWSQAYSEMIKMLAEDSLRVMAPPLLGGGTTFYTEEDMERAYGRGVRRSDAAIDYGQVMCLFEIQKGQVSLDTRQLGLYQRFIADTDRMVLGKAEQLDGTSRAIVSDEAALTGLPAPDHRRIFSLAVQGATYPVNPLTTEYITIKLRERGLMQDPRFSRFGVVDLGEIEMLEGLVDNHGVSVADVLEGWQTGPGWRYSLGNHLLEQYGGDVVSYRPKRMAATVDRLMDSLRSRLKLLPDPQSGDS
jgi:hypothetical protein